MDLIKIAEEAFATPKKNFDEFGPGDTITVAYRIKEAFAILMMAFGRFVYAIRIVAFFLFICRNIVCK